MRRHLNRKGQSTLEYVIIWTAIIAAILVGAEALKGKMGDEGGVMDKLSGKVTTEVENLAAEIGN